ncbi:hypothetical protein V9T40_007496 [Parthenolecanium corni]|uniref:Uncharacterized protein n=1 Tax=Parthenolecanium corni TaxID=536013 RepID=A0AAN9TJI5_9HEMI
METIGAGALDNTARIAIAPYPCLIERPYRHDKSISVQTARVAAEAGDGRLERIFGGQYVTSSNDAMRCDAMRCDAMPEEPYKPIDDI